VTCHEVGRLLDAYVDNELEPSLSAELQEHVAGCPTCSRRVADRESLGQLIRRIPYYPAPAHLRAALATVAARRSWLPTGPVALAASLLLAVSLGGATMIWRSLRANDAVQLEASIAGETVSAHVRSMMAAHLLDVPSSDQHTVKPWFLGKLDYAPPVEDLASAGFPLAGGRLDYIAGRPVAALVYQRRQHTINLFVWPAPMPHQTGTNGAQSIRGFQVRHWSGKGMAFWAVSDLNETDLTEFVRALQQRQ
jgi:anti-sigma factor RsiW